MSSPFHMPSPAQRRLQAILIITTWKIKTTRYGLLKRWLDLLVSGLALLLCLPLFALIATAIKLTDWGPVLFWQQRVGKNGRIFAFPKFRSMVLDAEIIRQRIEAQNQHGQDSVTFKMRRDPRITWIGRLLRRSSMDELPQLWCVFKGDMSLVGPRPALPTEVVRYGIKDRERLSVTPGLTCIWQVSGRSDIRFEQQVEMDIDYIQKPGLWQDILLLLRTVPAVILGRGAY